MKFISTNFVLLAVFFEFFIPYPALAKEIKSSWVVAETMIGLTTQSISSDGNFSLGIRCSRGKEPQIELYTKDVFVGKRFSEPSLTLYFDLNKSSKKSEGFRFSTVSSPSNHFWIRGEEDVTKEFLKNLKNSVSAEIKGTVTAIVNGERKEMEINSKFEFFGTDNALRAIESRGCVE